MGERTLLRRSRTLIGSDAAFLTIDGIDVDSTQNYEVVRRRVLFDDVQLVTLHHERGIAYLVVTGVFGLAFLGFGVMLTAIDTDTWPVALPFALVGVAILAAFVIRAAMGRDVITVFGRRSKAVMRFGSFQQQRAREVYGQVCAAVRRGQTATVAPEPEAIPLPADVPMPPESL